ncbi:sugar phosphate isomerase/epimerase [Demequina sp. NBRC 110055]|uniref:sugar phosphate isomerase/epimerase family protein n=1 Tax=Demequina sp. NBRC 110055 TaxID=1570344 RepID=UPI0009FEC0F2|nr:sugar phosphate isomerase/epimerase [Demequina sp. NBRC 110055]
MNRMTRRQTLLASTIVIACALPAAWMLARPEGEAREASVIADDQISAQLFNFFYYIGFGEDAETRARQDEVLASLSDAGYRYVEVVDYAGFHGLDDQEYRGLLDSHGLKVSALHTSVTAATSDVQWADQIDTALTLGTEFVGAGETPRDLATRDEWVAFAERIDQLGKSARDQGLTFLVHLHDWEFAEVDGDQTAFDILVEYTEPDNVVFELDLYWAAAAGVDPSVLVAEHRDRIPLLHVKDMAEDGSITTVGEGTVDFPAVFAAAGDDVEFYVVERDPIDDRGFDPFGPTVAGLSYLQSVDF